MVSTMQAPVHSKVNIQRQYKDGQGCGENNRLIGTGEVRELRTAQRPCISKAIKQTSRATRDITLSSSFHLLSSSNSLPFRLGWAPIKPQARLRNLERAYKSDFTNTCKIPNLAARLQNPERAYEFAFTNTRKIPTPTARRRNQDCAVESYDTKYLLNAEFNSAPLKSRLRLDKQAPKLKVRENDRWRCQRPKGKRRVQWAARLNHDQARRDAWVTYIYREQPEPEAFIKEVRSANIRRGIHPPLKTNTGVKSKGAKEVIFHLGEQTTDIESDNEDAAGIFDSLNNHFDSGISPSESANSSMAGSDEELTADMPNPSISVFELPSLRRNSQEPPDDEVEEIAEDPNSPDDDDNFGEGGSSRNPLGLKMTPRGLFSNIDSPTLSLGGRSHRAAEKQMQHLYDRSDAEDDDPEITNGDTVGFRRYANKPKDGPKLWKWADAHEELTRQYKESGMEFTSDDVPVGSGRLVEQYRAVRGVLYDHYFPLSKNGQGERIERNTAKGRPEVRFVRQAKEAMKSAAIAKCDGGYIEQRGKRCHYTRARRDGEYIEQRGKRCHYTTFIPARHILIAVRFVDAYGGLNATIAGMLSDLDMPHLASIGLSEGVSTGHTSTTGATSLATQVADEVKKNTNDILKVEEKTKSNTANLNSLKDETTAKSAEFHKTFAKVASRFKDIAKDVADAGKTLTGIETRIAKLDTRLTKVPRRCQIQP
ncbi:hypothetical protein BGZ61DRAFT_525610 [Ilyonectria robusta]|uniref:uncharacterized protein n=1 Tax=Ilyonectria robusta TaxID=1079257 RepID=UPI001E8E9069|nr:uncharacterized protein BGZ61DRAFT_525610 [Ilyonectria robusta]KAH8737493.1 hypothetical protein BGZ61DRAFT_525610 [Ilyonectria robusta]